MKYWTAAHIKMHSGEKSYNDAWVFFGKKKREKCELICLSPLKQPEEKDIFLDLDFLASNHKLILSKNNMSWNIPNQKLREYVLWWWAKWTDNTTHDTRGTTDTWTILVEDLIYCDLVVSPAKLCYSESRKMDSHVPGRLPWAFQLSMSTTAQRAGVENLGFMLFTQPCL